MSNGYQPPPYQPPQYQQPPQPQYYQPPPSQKGGGYGKWIALGGLGCFFFLLLVGGVLFVVFRMTPDPVKLVNEHLKAISSGDIEKAYSYTSSEFKKVTSREAFQEFVDSYPILKGAQEFTQADRSMDNGVTTLKGTIHGSNGSQQEAEYQLIKEGSDLKIQYIHLTGAGGSEESTKQQPAQEQETQQPQPEQATEPSEQAGGGLQISDIKVDKTSEGDAYKVVIEFAVSEFGMTDDRQLHLVQDLVTTDPSGNVIQDLNIPAINDETQNVPETITNPKMTFTNTLTIPGTFPHGTYTAKLVVHDKVGGQDAESEAQFDIP